MHLSNDFEPLILRTHPSVAQVKQILGALGTDLALLSGSGSAVFAFFRREQQARAAALALARQVDALTTARRQAQQIYEGGVTSLIEVRDTDRDLLIASDQLAQARGGVPGAGRRVEGGDRGDGAAGGRRGEPRGRLQPRP